MKKGTQVCIRLDLDKKRDKKFFDTLNNSGFSKKEYLMRAVEAYVESGESGGMGGITINQIVESVIRAMLSIAPQGVQLSPSPAPEPSVAKGSIKTIEPTGDIPDEVIIEPQKALTPKVPLYRRCFNAIKKSADRMCKRREYRRNKISGFHYLSVKRGRSNTRFTF